MTFLWGVLIALTIQCGMLWSRLWRVQSEVQTINARLQSVERGFGIPKYTKTQE